MTIPDHTRQAKTETRISLVILAVIVIVGACVYLRQFQFNPAVIALQPESQVLKSSAGPSPLAPIDVTGSDLVPFSPPERFDPDTLYQKINGRADLYLDAGFVSLHAQRFATGKSDGQWVELLVYDMATPDNLAPFWKNYAERDLPLEQTSRDHAILAFSPAVSTRHSLLIGYSSFRNVSN